MPGVHKPLQLSVAKRRHLKGNILTRQKSGGYILWTNCQVLIREL
jgi:hypothetical protein